MQGSHFLCVSALVSPREGDRFACQQCFLLFGPEYKFKHHVTKLLAFSYTEEMLKVSRWLMEVAREEFELY